VTSLVKETLSGDAAVQNKMSALIGAEVQRAAAAHAVDEDQVKRLVQAEVSAQRDAHVPDPSEQAEAVAKTDAMKAIFDEQFELFRAKVKSEVLDDLTRRASEFRSKAGDKK
jgi:hypothetical protein